MKRLIVIPLLFIFSFVFGETYYLQDPAYDGAMGSTASDENAGTVLTLPWATWQYAWDNVSAGDTVFVRGGVFYTTDDISINYLDGDRGDPIVFINYPGEIPIIDGVNKVTDSQGIYLTSCTNIYIKGIVVRNNPQITSIREATGFYLYNCNNITLDSCVAHNNGVRGFHAQEPDTISFINCDSYNNADSLSTAPGNAGDGFLVYDSGGEDDNIAYVTLYGCRAWHNSDDGYDLEIEGYVGIDRCWAINNGYLDEGDGTGIKIGLKDTWSDFLTRKVTNCISAYNSGYGITCNDKDTYPQHEEIYNNISYHNGYHVGSVTPYGFSVGKTVGTAAQELNRIFKNNISYDNEDGNIFISSGAYYTHEYNSWDNPPDVTVTDGDFLSVDSAGLTGARTAWGGLPILTFLHLDDDDLDGAGVNVGLTYDGDSLYHNTPPDLGAFAYDATEPEPPEYPQVTTTVTSTASIRVIATGTNIDDGGGTVSAKGICWNISTNPDTGDNIVPAGSGTDDFSCTLIVPSNTTIYISAYVTNETATTYGAVVQIDTPLTSPVIDDSGNVVLDDSGNIIIE